MCVGGGGGCNPLVRILECLKTFLWESSFQSQVVMLTSDTFLLNTLQGIHYHEIEVSYSVSVCDYR